VTAAFIVDGLTEKKIVQALCPGAPVRMTNLNGKNVAIEAIVKAVHSLVSLLRGRHYPIFILCDREGRDISSEKMESELLECLDALGIACGEAIVSCPDRMIENWMLADREYFSDFYGISLEEAFEGVNGKAKIRSLLKEKGVLYHETTIGVEIFQKVDPHSVGKNSISFARFRERADPFCRWLRKVS
jgi:hypothetical protein